MTRHAVLNIGTKTTKEGCLFLARCRPAGVKVQQFFQRIRFRDAVGIEQPYPVIAMVERILDAYFDGAARPQIYRLAYYDRVP